MGTWNTGLYDDDCALDVKDMYYDGVAAGKDPLEVINKIEKSIHYDYMAAVFVLADIQINELSMLVGKTKKIIMKNIEKELDELEEYWHEYDHDSRREEILKFKEKVEKYI